MQVKGTDKCERPFTYSMYELGGNTLMKERKIVSMFSIVLMGAALLTACGKVTVPVLMVFDPAATNTLTINLPETLGGGTVASDLVGNISTSVIVDTTNIMSAQGASATVTVNSFEAAGTSVNLGEFDSGTLCLSIPVGAEAGGIALLRPWKGKYAAFQLTIPTETTSMDPNFAEAIGPINLTLNIDATLTLDLGGLLNLMFKGTGLNIHQTLTLTLPGDVPLLGGSTVVLDMTLKSQKAKITDPKIDACNAIPVVVCGDSVIDASEECDDGNTANNDGCSSTCKTEICGDDVIQTGETCDPPSSCPISCDDADVCTTDEMTGSADTCTAACTHTPIENCNP
jgi:cysteine-rich repeat protein